MIRRYYKVKYQAVFQRYEKKYLIRQSMYEQILRELSPYMQRDQYGLHTITSLYCDTDDYALIRASLQKPVFKEKLRLRCYGQPAMEDEVYLELKKKFNGVVYKRRISLPLYDAEEYLQGTGSIRDRGQIAEEIEWFVSRYRPSPKLLLAYDRIALYGTDDPQLRITFDQNVRWRDHDLNLSRGSYGTPLMPGGDILMEIKAFAAVPLWLSGILSVNRLYPTSFSKYGTWYQDCYLRGEGRRYA